MNIQSLKPIGGYVIIIFYFFGSPTHLPNWVFVGCHGNLSFPLPLSNTPVCGGTFVTTSKLSPSFTAVVYFPRIPAC
ncbi:hypothetical protein DM01DRAFT_1196153 [Hesseltinella vesiculosa]|uniref:Uncharacterized protein n=1 Tax=Hesseltinella vesiculosa TaxID=101127 RepID=A0A1X2G3N6_9FUNG|nr:hypothetical protein DM01DRAFT_1196153 [Hesseltinella vesiculosa]